MKTKTKFCVTSLIIIGIVVISIPYLILPNLTIPIFSIPSTYVSQLTGESALNNSEPFDVMGTDLGIVVKYNGQFRYIFGDTFGGDFSVWAGTDWHWRSNVMAYSNDTTPADGIRIDGWIANTSTGYARELIHSRKIDNLEMTCIPTAAYTDGIHFYIFYMSVKHWGAAGEWECNNASIAYSREGSTFTKIDTVSWPGGGNFNMFGVVQNSTGGGLSDDDVYIFATPSGRFGNAFLMKVSKNEILNQSAYLYYAGLDDDAPIWSPLKLTAKSVIKGPIGELSAMWNPYLNKFIVVYFQSNVEKIVYRTADHPWGPWSIPTAIANSTTYPGLYGGFIHPELAEHNGQIVYYVMSVWGIYNTFVLKCDLS